MSTVIKTFPIKTISVDKIDPPPGNPNAMTGQDFETLCSLMKAEGFLQPVLVRDIGKGRVQVVDGDHRTTAAKKLGMDQIPCVVLPADYSDSKAKLLQIAMNKLRGGLELTDVARSLQDVIAAGDIDATLSGFSTDAINDMIAALKPMDDSLQDILGSGDKPNKGSRPQVDTYMLEIPFETAAQLKQAKKALKQAGNGDLSAGLLSLLGN